MSLFKSAKTGKSPRPSLFVPLCVSVVAHGLLLLGAVQMVSPRGELPSGPISVVVGRGGEVRSTGGRQTSLPAPAVDKPELHQGKAALLATTEKINETQERAAPQPAHALAPTVPAVDALSGRGIGGGSQTGKEGGKESGGTVSADDLRSYRMSLASAAKRFKRYPALARERGWEGSVEVGISISAAMPVPEVSIGKSSGRSVLDEQAREMLLQAVRSTPLPESFKGRDVKLMLPVKFGLDDE